ncbi:diguanylate cyclase domain-containing protein [Aerosakkonemataceae cyanobacterium BLCC-F154]|uniref:Diguanylate cyclase domain-containing protein n=1 Tax=Floridaenema fluviatile BLCC-F154 TaxID=3153640 RepID=A0ABV4Y6M9_9CYAN
MITQHELDYDLPATFRPYIPYIMIVDDRLENIRLLADILTTTGYLTRKAINGALALQAIENEPPTLILLDIKMPGINGFEVFEKVRSNPKTAHIPIIFLSAASNLEYKEQAFNMGCADYITKPFYIEEVRARVQHQLTIIAAKEKIIHLITQLDETVKQRTQCLEIANAQLTEMAFHDSLTKLANRELLSQRLRQAIEQQKANYNYNFAVFYLDCDRFKAVNDSLGHQAGDELLIAISQRLKSLVRQEDLVARLGGDEFVILVSNLGNFDTISLISERIWHTFSLPITVKEKQIFVSFSIGIISECSQYETPEQILEAADMAMYETKYSRKYQEQIESGMNVKKAA